MNEELKQLAALALRNAFWHDFSALANKYLETAKGLDTDLQEALMGEMTSIYGRDLSAEDDVFVNLWIQGDGHERIFVGHETILAALEYKNATEVHLCGKRVFERRDGGWHFTGG